MKPKAIHFLGNPFRWRSIQMRFTVPSLLLLLVAIGLIGFFLIRAGLGNSEVYMAQMQQQVLQQVNDQLSQRLQAAMQLNQINYDSFEAGILKLDDPSPRERYFANHLKSFPDVAMTFIGMADGSFYGARRTAEGDIQVVRNNTATGGASWYYQTNEWGDALDVVEKFSNFDPRTRPWYTKAAEAGIPTFSGTHSHFVFHEPAVTASYPVYDSDGRLIGVFGVDYLLSWLGDTLGKLPIGPSGQVFVTDDAGMLIAVSSGGPSYRMADNGSELIPAKESNNPMVRATMALPLNQYRNGSLSGFRVDGRQYYVGISNFQEYGNNWKIYVVLSADDFLGGTKSALRQTALVLMIAVLLSLFFTIWTGSWVTRPIMRLNIAARELSRGNRLPIHDDGRRDELGELNRSFNEMGLKLINLVTHLEEEVSLRTQELQERNEELHQLSFSDGLTGIANRRLFDDAIRAAWSTARRHGRQVAVFMLDIDLFKDYNDTYGHQAGDDCLKAIGRVLTEKTRRSTDLAARYGGEEFAVVLQDAQIDQLQSFAEDIRRGVEALELEHRLSPYGKVTVSIGVAHAAPAAGTEPTDLIERADRALYRAKERGRNRVEPNEPKVD